MKWWKPNAVPHKHFSEQMARAQTNFFLLIAYQTLWECCILNGWTKVVTGNLQILEIIRDVLLWMLVFELSWYNFILTLYWSIRLYF